MPETKDTGDHSIPRNAQGDIEHESLIGRDTDGYTRGEVDGDTFTYCYAHAGGKTQSSVISCSEAKRAE